MTREQRFPIIKQRGRVFRIRQFLKKCGLSGEQIKQFSETAIEEVSDLIHTGIFGEMKYV